MKREYVRKEENVKGYKVTAKYGSNTIEFELPIVVKQESLKEALESARDIAADAFSLNKPLLYPDTLQVTIQEYYED